MGIPNTGLVLSAGGARGAYQVGVVKALAEMGLTSDGTCPFDVLSGVSAGSINVGAIATLAEDFSKAAELLEQMWENLTAEQVFRTDIKSLSGIGMRWMRDLSLGGMVGGGTARALLDTQPLRELLSRQFVFGKIEKNLAKGYLSALAVTATNYYSANAVTFVQSKGEEKMWKRRKRVGEQATINVEHLMASSAIPVFFPSVEIEGRHFGDGCVRNLAPLSPAVHLGAEKIVAVGVRQDMEVSEDNVGPNHNPSIAQIVSVILDAVMLDSIEMDVIRAQRVNDMLRALQANQPKGQASPYRPIDVVWISPSEDLGKIATSYYKKLPRIVRYLLKGLGPDAAMTDTVSYLLFEKSYHSRLIELGYHDGMAARDKVENMMTKA